MALFIRQDDNRTELQQRLASELQEKARKRAQDENKRPDGVDDSAYIKDTVGTSKHAWVWVVLAVVAVIGIFVLIVTTH